MKRQARRRIRRRSQRQPLGVERLEQRIVLDNHLGLALADVVEEPQFSQFASPEELKTYLIESAVQRYEHQFGEELGWYRQPYPFFPPESFERDSGPVRIATDNFSTTEHGTNVQVRGVDEGDLFKTDGSYLYHASWDQLTIIDVQDPTDMRIASRIPLDRPVREMVVYEDRLTLIADASPYIDWMGGFAPQTVFPATFDGMWEMPERGTPEVSISVFDISDRDAPVLSERTDVEGHLVESRAIDNFVYVVTQHNISLPGPEVQCTTVTPEETADGERLRDLRRGDLHFSHLNPGDLDLEPWDLDDVSLDPFGVSELDLDPFVDSPIDIIPYGRGDVFTLPEFRQNCHWETKDDYLARFEGESLERYLPRSSTVNAAGEEVTDGFLIDAEGVYRPSEGRPSNLLSISVLNVAGEAPGIDMTSSALTEHIQELYATQDSIYAAHFDWGKVRTSILEFSIEEAGAEVALAAIGTVEGRPVNQFAFDEYEGLLRVATTQGFGADTTNRITVLQQQEDRLEALGQTEDLAKGETIYAARFAEDAAFLVTFRQIDPLFSVDLSDPENPTVKGKLKIPGFSNYLQFVGDGFLIGLGRDADPATGWAGEPQLSLFNVEDLSDSLLVDQISIDANGSEALHNHHAVSFFPEQGILVVPFYGFKWGIREPAIERPFNSFWVFQIQPELGEDAIRLLGQIDHQSMAQRSFLAGEHLLTVSAEEVQSHPILDPEQQVDAVYLGPTVFGDRFEVDLEGDSSELDVLANDHVGEVAKVTDVTDSRQGGEVTIAEDGRSLLYTPPEEPILHDSFRYTVERADGGTETAHVTIDVTWEVAQQRMVGLAKLNLANRLEVEMESIDVLSAQRRLSPIRIDPGDEVHGDEVHGDAASGDTEPGAEGDAEAGGQELGPGFTIELGHGGRRYTFQTDLADGVFLEGEDDDRIVFVRPDEFHVEPNSEDNALDVLANDFHGVINVLVAPRVSEVTAPSEGGEVEISRDGLRLLYTPAADFTGTETFTYTTLGQSAKVEVHVEDRPDSVRVKLQPTDAEGLPLTTVAVGQSFFIDVLVEDLRDVPDGVFSAYLDVIYDSTRAESDGEVVAGIEYPNGFSGGASTPGLIDEVGAFAAMEPVGGGEHVLARIPMVATAAGPLELAANPADVLPAHAVGVYGSDEAVPSVAIDYGETVIQVTGGLHNADRPHDTNADGEVSAIDALVIINVLNVIGPMTTAELIDTERLAVASGESASDSIGMYYDVNGDQFVSAIDVLQVVNEIERLNSLAEGESFRFVTSVSEPPPDSSEPDAAVIPIAPANVVVVDDTEAIVGQLAEDVELGQERPEDTFFADLFRFESNGEAL